MEMIKKSQIHVVAFTCNVVDLLLRYPLLIILVEYILIGETTLWPLVEAAALLAPCSVARWEAPTIERPMLVSISPPDISTLQRFFEEASGVVYRNRAELSRVVDSLEEEDCLAVFARRRENAD